MNPKQPLIDHNIKLAHIVALDNQYCIGKNNQLAWHVPEDLQYFKKRTTGSVVIMGNNTFKSIGKPLPGRTNIVLSRNTTWQQKDIVVAHSLPEALALAAQYAQNSPQSDRVFIIGGATLYTQTLVLADLLYISQIDTRIHGDAFYPTDWSDFVLTDKSPTQNSVSGLAYCFMTYQKSPSAP